ncbi:hypothetical protein EVAR_64514_1 [Eumeta japonica]|uniref:Uncharacterized protein n=1 Tax=Eumeta variegata TaxID=151549 RepID=A0A4C2A396_EUMVA|nr:hypothetical protein EVAR_64514_1 [Eumeta japonica]
MSKCYDILENDIHNTAYTKLAYGSESIIYWGRFCVTVRTELVFMYREGRKQDFNTAQYITDILEEQVTPFAGTNRYAEPFESRWLSVPVDTHNPRGVHKCVIGALERIGYLIKEIVD